MMLIVLLLLAIVFGVIVGRSWAVAAAIPVGAWAAWEIPLENAEPPHWEVGLFATMITAVAVLIGVMARHYWQPGNSS